MSRSKKWLAACLAGVMAVSLMGCGGPVGKDGQGTEADSEGVTGDGDTAMGRYMESSQTLDIGRVTDVVKLTDGRLELLEDGAEGRYISSDGGITWEADILPFWYDLVMESYVVDMKGAPDGSVAVLGRRYGTPVGDWELAEDDTDSEEAESVCELLLFSPAGEEKRFSLPDPEGYTLSNLCFSEDGERLFLSTRDEEIYEIDKETGEKRLLMQIDIRPDVFCVWEQYLAAKSEQDGIFLYDLDTGEKIEDEVLSDFVAQNYKRDDNVFSSTYTIFPAEDGSIYLAGAKGLHRHVIGGAVMEQVINGGLCGLSDPSNPVSVMMRTANDGFMAAYSEGKISSFTYDPDIPSTPSQTLVAYSLTESDILRQAITRYQEANPDVYVEYRVGLSEEGGATKEDAIKKLNTEIMAGKGPDLLVLDGLPIDSYKEKGVLSDISPYLAKLETEEPLLPNIKESFTEGGKITMIPAAVTLSMYYAEQENMTGVSDLSALADLFEKLRKDHPGEELMELYSKDMLFDAVFPVSAPNWISASGEPDMEKISGDLEQMKRIYDACMEGLPDRVLLKYKGYMENIASSDKASAYNDLGGGGVQIAGGNVQVSMGALTNGYNYGLLQSVKRMEGKEDNRLAQIPGSAADAFTPVALMGINAASQKSDLAGDFMQMILSKEMQSMIYPIGFPINEEGLERYLESLGGQVPESLRKPGEPYGSYGLSGDDGIIIVNMYVPTKEEAEELCDTLKMVRTPYLRQEALEDAVREMAEVYFDGICSLEEMMDGIREKSAIIMAE
ncbi:MAG: extracellular solute-binding protein [Lachnospiraceae bacterium]|nr:extracellular solute-binding protein [Lachnospiraceae bacterium]